MTDVTWREPPERPSGVRFAEEAVQMREHPGKWLLLQAFPRERGTHARSMGNSVKIGRYTALRPAGAFEPRTATEPDERGNLVVNVYARYVGADDGG